VGFLVVHEVEPGSSVYLPVDDLTAAVAEVERLRNDEQVTDAAIFELRAVSFDYEPYYRVALADELRSAARSDTGWLAAATRAVEGREGALPSGESRHHEDEDGEPCDDEPYDPIDLRERQLRAVGFGDFPNRRGLFGP
jgi:hypothetical protein